MKTILYNTETNESLPEEYNGGFMVDGKPGLVEEPYIELQLVEEEQPEYNPSLQVRTSKWVADLENLEYRLEWTVRDKTESELITDIETAALESEMKVEELALEKLKAERVEQIKQEIELLDDEAALEVKDLYKPYRVGIVLKPNERFYYPLDGKLYKVIGAEHTTQLDWKPDEAVSLYEHVYVVPPGDICDTSPAWNSNNWGQYTVGYHVKHNGAVYQAKNTTHTWIAPAKTGDGAISWEWIKDCN
jgi:hypothetical protein